MHPETDRLVRGRKRTEQIETLGIARALLIFVGLVVLALDGYCVATADDRAVDIARSEFSKIERRTGKVDLAAMDARIVEAQGQVQLVHGFSALVGLSLLLSAIFIRRWPRALSLSAIILITIAMISTASIDGRPKKALAMRGPLIVMLVPAAYRAFRSHTDDS